MGLDYVELIMRAEEEFGITIEDSEAENISTPGQLCALVERKLGDVETVERSFCPTSRAFYRVRRELVACGSNRNFVTPNASLNRLLPHSHHHPHWRALSANLGLNLPLLVRSPLLSAQNKGLSSLLSGFTLWFFGYAPTPDLMDEAGMRVQTVGDLARRLARRSGPSIHKKDVWPRVQLIVAEELSVPIEQVTRDADFFRDLGTG